MVDFNYQDIFQIFFGKKMEERKVGVGREKYFFIVIRFFCLIKDGGGIRIFQDIIFLDLCFLNFCL